MELSFCKENLWDDRPRDNEKEWEARATIGLLVKDDQLHHIRNAIKNITGEFRTLLLDEEGNLEHIQQMEDIVYILKIMETECYKLHELGLELRATVGTLHSEGYSTGRIVEKLKKFKKGIFCILNHKAETGLLANKERTEQLIARMPHTRYGN
ncbi:hypothetical protein ILUMI_11557 [Ignelater luminosus]|uniref:Uncharacterized protein n=1 Tax=Ignelater luminosus TaxID=2038154 RepID=A0A8K0D174_IGNLU|nr:hypothetical protein ILUMI_11557 [Ignelater luminosus]